MTDRVALRARINPHYGFLKHVVTCTTSYDEGWREICQLLIDADAALALLDAEPERPQAYICEVWRHEHDGAEPESRAPEGQ